MSIRKRSLTSVLAVLLLLVAIVPIASASSPTVRQCSGPVLATTIYADPGDTYIPGGGSVSSQPFLIVGYRGGTDYVTLLPFRVSLPNGSCVLRAKLLVRVADPVGATPRMIRVRRITPTAGLADVYDATLMVAGWNRWDVTRLVRAWVDGIYLNYGMALQGPTGVADYLYYINSADGGTAVPRLRVVYQLP